jgi:hypothetical protein
MAILLDLVPFFIASLQIYTGHLAIIDEDCFDNLHAALSAVSTSYICPNKYLSMLLSFHLSI